MPFLAVPVVLVVSLPSACGVRVLHLKSYANAVITWQMDGRMAQCTVAGSSYGVGVVVAKHVLCVFPPVNPTQEVVRK